MLFTGNFFCTSKRRSIENAVRVSYQPATCKRKKFVGEDCRGGPTILTHTQRRTHLRRNLKPSPLLSPTALMPTLYLTTDHITLFCNILSPVASLATLST
jgi:hypothetical protein